MNSSFVMVIFGATGALMKNKLLPSLLKLYQEEKLGKKFYIVGFARRPFTNEEFRKDISNHLRSINLYHKAWEIFKNNLYYQQGDFKEQKAYRLLNKVIKKFDVQTGAQLPRFLYLATPPIHYEDILDNLHKANLDHGNNARIIVEKPFGKDLRTAISLDKKVSMLFKESQIFRVDHYLGKETVQNMVAFRFANGGFEPVWNKNYIDHI